MKQLGIEGLGAVWTKVFELLKKITGNVDVQNKGDLQTQINNLIKKIPAAANNGKLTIQKNGTNVQSFTANQNGDATANIIVPNVTRSAAVTQEGQLALDAIEKNASIEGTLANELGKINSKLTPQPFNITLNPDHCSKSYSVCYRIGNIAVLSLYLDIKNIVINSRTLIATLPFKIKNTSICTVISTKGEKVNLRLENIDNIYGVLIIDPPYNTAIESDTILQQYVAIIE